MRKILVFIVGVLISSNVLAMDIPIGVGVGIPYGLVGVNASYELLNNTDLMIAVSGFGVGFGARFYPLELYEKARITAYFGPSHFSRLTNTAGDLDTLRGISFGVGYGDVSNGWNADMIYSFASGLSSSKLEDAGLDVNNYFGAKWALGYHW
jgi:hypothetical protein